MPSTAAVWADRQVAEHPEEEHLALVAREPLEERLDALAPEAVEGAVGRVGQRRLVAQEAG
ncbi:MAG: hypothetical protein KatS3mg010_1578 [Acidimicrobiia bacterium]|nr:MAG: hypothetical protein KatS3mg010_1578 [Acidimicrobiia bacterium]